MFRIIRFFIPMFVLQFGRFSYQTILGERNETRALGTAHV